MIYFGHLCHWGPDELRAKLEQLTADDQLRILSQQLVEMSKHNWAKHRAVHARTTGPTARSRRPPSPEGLTQVAIMLAIGGAAGAASFTNAHDVAAAYGQAGWLAWADAVVLELMSVASGLELRGRNTTATLRDLLVVSPQTGRGHH